MGQLGTIVKRFLSNKNTVTLVAIIICTLLLYGFYNWRVKSAVTTTYACYATQKIPARTEITADMVTTKKVLQSTVTANTVTNCQSVVGKYVSYATEIQENSFLYQGMIMDKEEMPDSAFDDIPDEYTIYNFKVDFNTTYGNSIFPDDSIDLYMSTSDPDTRLPIYGKFIEKIKVLAVKDDKGQNVFETTVETRQPSQLLFAVPEDLYLLLKKAEILGINIVIVPRNNNYSAKEGQTLVSSDYLKSIIENQTGDIPDECVKAETGTAECQLAKEDTTNPQDTDVAPTE